MASNHSDTHAHIIPWRVYLFTLLALLFLMGVTIWASYIQLPPIGPFSGVAMNNIFSMLIATAKALLVICIFMGVWYQTKLVKMWAATGFIILALMFGIYVDYITRPYEAVPGWEPGVEGAALPKFPVSKETGAPKPKDTTLGTRLRSRDGMY